ncbi:tetratricopeptide repeat protein [Neobacillus sp. SuZ13]|uniref:tetratricopeptide repeat protein n=1 Tax=Neobacillus sp. SuZ13 TaxID=3047875 RepID=UPI0024C018EE|nr:tetratricopeptide repeat protein [Neobacillus sp. SuZ13]WHY67870.1 tetratricopeptide repeat protein [Neobacillus sp. SuZ13]
MEIQSYNLAIQYLKAEQYEEAALILEKMIKEYPLCTDVSWALGLLHVLSGFPQQALKQWKNLQTANYLTTRQMLEEKVPLYDELYLNYNQAVQLIGAGEFHLAKNIFHDLLTFQVELPLPVDFYHGYLLTQIVTGEKKDVAQEINHMPLYVKNSSVIRELEHWLENHQLPEPDSTDQKSFKKGWSKRLILGSSLVASLLMGGVGLRVFSQQKEISEAKPVFLYHESPPKTEIFKKVTVGSKGHSEGQVKQQDSINANSRLESSTKASLSTYREGLTAFRNRDYRAAAAQMEKSLSLEPNEYFSDDAMFFLIESKQRLNEKGNIHFLYDHFFSQTSPHYVYSPYFDELLLGKAKILIDDGNTKDALPFLEKILTDYRQEWTAVEATLMMNQIKAEDKS